MAATEPTRTRRWSRWMTAWTVLSVPGLCLLAIAVKPGPMLALVVVVTVIWGFTLLVHERTHDPRQTDRAGTGWVSRVVLCGIALVLSTAGVAAIVPVLALLVACAAIATAPPVGDLCRRVLGRADQVQEHPPSAKAPREHPPALHPPIDTARTMTDQQLCHAWRRSYWPLKDARDPVEKLRLVEQRTRLLDELEARNPAALAAWLCSGARACDGLDEFFVDDGGGQTTAA